MSRASRSARSIICCVAGIGSVAGAGVRGVVGASAAGGSADSRPSPASRMATPSGVSVCAGGSATAHGAGADQPLELAEQRVGDVVLLDVVVGAVERVGRPLVAGAVVDRRHQHHVRRRRAPLDLLDHLVRVHAGQRHVEHQRRRPPLERGQRGAPVADRVHRVAGVEAQPADRLADGLGLVRDDDGGLSHARRLRRGAGQARQGLLLRRRQERVDVEHHQHLAVVRDHAGEVGALGDRQPRRRLDLGARHAQRLGDAVDHEPDDGALGADIDRRR